MSEAPAVQRPAMLSLDEALARLLQTVKPLGQTARIPTQDALGRVLAADIQSLLDVPPQDNTSMDGYAVRAADVLEAGGVGAVLRVTQRLPAGVVGEMLQPGTAARIFTGAQIPPGADAVVMQEQCELVAGGAEPRAGDWGAVRIQATVQAGQWIRRRGEDVQQGSTVLKSGARLDAAALGLAASVGAAQLTVARRPRVALFSTGDELVMPSDPPLPLKPGAIYNSNRFTLRGLLQGLGCEVIDLGLVPDRLDATRAALREAAQHADLILTSGGVSVGEEDHVRPAVQAEGRLDLWHIAIKPGKPLAFGDVRRAALTPTATTMATAAAGDGSAWFMGLPGNPVASFVTFLLLVRPVILQLQGASRLASRGFELRADFDWPRADKRREFLRVRVNDAGGLDLFPNQSSGVLSSAVWADGLVDNPPGQIIARGDRVRFLPLSELLS